MLFRSIAAFFFMLMLAGAPQAGTILVWGDSLSAGYGLRPGEEWPKLLQTRLEHEGFRYSVVNGSVSGETSSGGLTRLPAALDQHKPDILILELGANDGLRGLRPQLMEDNLGAMVEAGRQSGAVVVLVGMRMPPNYGPAFTRRFEEAFHNLAQRFDLPFVPFLLEGFADQPEMFLPDGIHPTAEAQPVIVDTIWGTLRPLLAP